MAHVTQSASFESFDEAVEAYKRLKDQPDAKGVQLIASLGDDGHEHVSLTWSKEQDI